MPFSVPAIMSCEKLVELTILLYRPLSQESYRLLAAPMVLKVNVMVLSIILYKLTDQDASDGRRISIRSERMIRGWA